MSGKSKRGFASMDPARQREIASRGGRAAHEKGTAHEWTPDEARVAGRKGGEVVSRDRDHMSAIGREGGEARGRNNAIARANGSSDRESTMHVAREGMPPAVTRGPQRSTTRDERATA
ncbi:MAG: KGG domain-containing protein [Gemmatimonadaceae bacterium]